MDNNFNNQSNNGISNNQPLQNNLNINNNNLQNIQPSSNINQTTFNNQGLTPNTQNINNPTYQNNNTNQQTFNSQQQANTNSTLNYQQSSNTTSSNYNPPKKNNLNLGLIIGIAVVVIIVIGIIIFSTNNKNNDNKNLFNNSTNKEEIVYYDSDREFKDTYTFKEAVSEFAFLVGNSTLIFKEKDKITFDSVTLDYTIYNELDNIQFRYKQDIYTSLGDIHVGESNSSNLEEFKTNFEKGILSDNVSYTVENVRIIESNEDYVFASWIKKGNTTSYQHYFAKKIGDKVYYSYHQSLLELNDTKITLLLNEFKELFTCLSKDDGTTAYIQDKIMNVPVVLNKQIKNVDYIFSIVNSTNEYHDGFLTLTLDYITNLTLTYGASGHYDKIDWTKDINSSIKYTYEDDKNIFGVVDNGLTQIFEVNSTEEINTEKEFNNYIDDIFYN